MRKAEPRKNAKQDRAKVTVDSIVEATSLLLSELGLKKITTNKIVKKAGVSIGSLYQYFPGKEAIFAIVFEKQLRSDLEKFRVKIDSLSPKTHTLKEAIDELVFFFMQDFYSQSKIYQELLYSVLTIKSLRFTLEHDQLVEKYIGDFVKRYKEDVRDDFDLPLFTFIIQYTVKGLKFGIAFNEKSDYLDDIASHLSVVIHQHLKS